jgi:hypothetical protein
MLITPPLLTTKLTTPEIRLIDLFGNPPEIRITLLSAKAGPGKKATN